MITKFELFINESTYEADVALENLFYKILGDYFLDNRSEILDNIYSKLSAHTVNWAFENLCNDYPDLEKYQDDFYKAAEKEGYYISTEQKFKDGDFN